MDGSRLKFGHDPRLEILYEDRCIIAVNKPSGQLFQGFTNGLPQTLDAQLKAYIRSQKVEEGSDNTYLGIVHRLDRPVSGVVVFARNSKFAGRLGLQFQNREVEKTYIAVVEGVIKDDNLEWIDELPQDPDEDAGVSPIKHCQLSFKVIARRDNRTSVEINLGTGRRNQIRRQFSKRGFPIVGDMKFGASSKVAGFEDVDALFHPIALHADRLTFIHPKAGELQTITAPKPNWWD